MADPEHLKIIKQGVKAFNRRQGKNPDIVFHLAKADLRGAKLKGANLRGADLGRAHLRDSRLSFADLSGANLRGADLSRANLNGVNLSGADLTRADLRVAHLSRANLSGADLSGANLKGVYLNGADLSWVHLSKARLSWAILSRANLRGALLSGANLRGANLRGAVLNETNLLGAHLRGADLSGACLNEADLRSAHLRGANLSEADLSGADLRDADLRQAILVNTIITSRTVLTLLRIALTDEQKGAIIFSDEREMAQKNSRAKKSNDYQCLTIELKNEVPWKNEWMAFLLLSIQTAYNNCFYLSRTADKDIEIIKSKLKRKCQVSAPNDLELRITQQHYSLILQYVQYAIENVPQVTTVLSILAALIDVISKNYETVAKRKKSEKNSQKIATEILKNLQKELEQIEISTSNDVVLRDAGKLLFLASKDLLNVLGALRETANIRDILVKMKKVND